MKTSLLLTTSTLLAALVAAFCLARTIPAFAQEKRMAIQGFGPELPIEIGGNAWFIFLDGVIDSKAATRFEQYIKDNRIPDRSYVYLNSPGGSLIEGIGLGRIIRKYRLSTNVGKRSLAQPEGSISNRVAATVLAPTPIWVVNSGTLQKAHAMAFINLHPPAEAKGALR